MGDKTGITWTDSTWNPVTGCAPVSAGCDNCYAARYAKRGMGDFAPVRNAIPGGSAILGRSFSEVKTHPDRLVIPIHWKKPRKIFVCSMGDLFHESVPEEFINGVFAVMALCPQHTFQVLTKRVGRMHAYMCNPRPLLIHDTIMIGMQRFAHRFEWPLPNVWLGVTAENQNAWSHRVPLFAQIGAAVKFVSCEPLLGPIFCGDPRSHAVDWIICGGESGPHARPMHPDWVRSLRDQCKLARIPFHFKQWGEYCAPSQMPAETYRAWDYHHGTENCWNKDDPGRWRVGKKAAGRLLDGREWLEFPEPKQQEIDRQC
jgi:protein gp37